MSKHSHIDPCCKELRGIIMSHIPPACQDVVWLQPVKPGLFRWMVPTPYKNHTWMPVAVEQPIPKNALLEYFYDKIQENSMSPFKFYSESDTEALLGAYIYDEQGNVSMQGMLDFHCDEGQEGEDRIHFSQTVIDYEQEIGTYIKQFYDKIILSIKFPGGEQVFEINPDGVFIGGTRVITVDNIEEYGVTSVKTEAGSFTYEGVTYSLIKLTPTTATKGNVTITGNIDGDALLAFLNQAATEGDLLKHYKETFEENDGIPTVNNSVDVSVKYNGVLGSLGLWAVNELDGWLDEAPTDLTNYYKEPGTYSCLYTEDEDSDDGCRTSVQTLPDYIKFTVDCSKKTENYYHNRVVMDKEKFHIEKNLYVDGDSYFFGDVYLGDILLDPNIFINGLVNSVSATANKTENYQILTLTASPTTGAVKITGGIDKDALVALINELLKNHEIDAGVTSVTTKVTKTGDYQIITLTTNPTTGDVIITGGIDKDALVALINQLIKDKEIPIEKEAVLLKSSFTTDTTIAKDVDMVTGTISGNVSFIYSAIPETAHETHFILKASGSTTLTFPVSNSKYLVVDGNETLSLTDGQWAEFNYISDGEDVYIRSTING